MTHQTSVRAAPVVAAIRTASVRRIGRLCARAGAIVGGASLFAGALCVPLLAAGSVPATATRIAALVGVSALTLSGVELVFHVAALGLLVGCWLLGAGLLIAGLFDDPG